MESFLTLQGEGFHTGKLAYFIRLGGCDVGCVWCDVKESWEAEKHPMSSVTDIIESAVGSKSEITVITGGEPLMYDLSYLTDELKLSGLKTHIETSGVYPLTGQWDWVCFSPKKFKEPQEEFYYKSDELKVIVFNKSDLKWAEEHAQKMQNNALLYLQPEWSKREAVTPLIIDYIKQNPKWRISLQVHKYMNIP
ncbi:MAG: radical SAM protein [Cyclobacteriaceae bacterium]|nr:radical SAM protein [Cyclobacteriaceae bacterium SS2]